MSSLKFEWNTRKAATNARKHGVTFEEARTVFLDEGTRLIDDPDHSEDEERFVLLGLSILYDYFWSVIVTGVMVE